MEVYGSNCRITVQDHKTFENMSLVPFKKIAAFSTIRLGQFEDKFRTKNKIAIILTNNINNVIELI